jgi:hypothetical protein
VATRANNIGSILKAQRDLTGALESTRRALAIDEKVYGLDHPQVARDVNNIGQILQDQGDLAGALPYAGVRSVSSKRCTVRTTRKPKPR